jgi:hypothetical protein
MASQLFGASFAAMSNPNEARVRIYIPLVPPDNQSCSGPLSSQRRWTDDRFKLSAVDGPLPSGQYRVIPRRSRAKACRSPPGMARQVVFFDPNELGAALAADGLESQD